MLTVHFIFLIFLFIFQAFVGNFSPQQRWLTEPLRSSEPIHFFKVKLYFTCVNKTNKCVHFVTSELLSETLKCQ